MLLPTDLRPILSLPPDERNTITDRTRLRIRNQQVAGSIPAGGSIYMPCNQSIMGTRSFGCAVELPRVGTQTGTQIGTQRFGFGVANRANSLGTTNGPASRQLRPSEPEFRTGEQQSVGRPDRRATFQIHFSFPVCIALSTRDESGQAEDQCRHSRPIGWRRRYYLRFFRRFMMGLFNRDQASGSEPPLRKLWFGGSILDTTRDVGSGAAKAMGVESSPRSWHSAN